MLPSCFKAKSLVPLYNRQTYARTSKKQTLLDFKIRTGFEVIFGTCRLQDLSRLTRDRQERSWVMNGRRRRRRCFFTCVGDDGIGVSGLETGTSDTVFNQLRTPDASGTGKSGVAFQREDAGPAIPFLIN